MARRFDRRRFGLSLLVAFALVLIVYGFASARTGDAALTITDAAVEGVYPAPGAIVLRQSEIRVDLAPGYRGELIIDGRNVPTYDLIATEGGGPVDPNFDAVFDPGLNTVSFTPKVGAIIERLEPDRHTVTAVFWKLDDTRDHARSVSWSFKVS